MSDKMLVFEKELDRLVQDLEKELERLMKLRESAFFTSEIDKQIADIRVLLTKYTIYREKLKKSPKSIRILHWIMSLMRKILNLNSALAKQTQKKQRLVSKKRTEPEESQEEKTEQLTKEESLSLQKDGLEQASQLQIPTAPAADLVIDPKIFDQSLIWLLQLAENEEKKKKREISLVQPPQEEKAAKSLPATETTKYYHDLLLRFLDIKLSKDSNQKDKDGNRDRLFDITRHQYFDHCHPRHQHQSAKHTSPSPASPSPASPSQQTDQEQEERRFLLNVTLKIVVMMHILTLEQQLSHSHNQPRRNPQESFLKKLQQAQLLKLSNRGNARIV